MATLQDAIDEIQAEVRDVAGMRAAPDEPPDSMNHFPFAVCYAHTGSYRIGPPDTMHGIHELYLEVHVARKDLERDIAAAMPFAKSVPDAIFSAYAAGSLTAVEVIQRIAYEFGPMTWGGVLTLGFRFTIEGVKTQDGI